jgi:hypothetical protein
MGDDTVEADVLSVASNTCAHLHAQPCVAHTLRDARRLWRGGGVCWAQKQLVIKAEAAALTQAALAVFESVSLETRSTNAR